MTDSATSALMPDTLPDFTAEDVAKDASYPELRTDAAMRFIIKEVEKTVSDNSGSLGIVLNVRPLNKENKPVYPGSRMRLTCPFKNPTATGKKYETVAPNTLSQWHSFLSALYPNDFPSFPKRTGKVWVTAAGEELSTKEDNEAARQKICAAVRERIQHYWKNTGELLNEVFIAQPVCEKSQNGQEYINLDPYKVWSVDEPPTDVEVITEKFAG